MDERESIRCPHCELNQFKLPTGNCRRCNKALGSGSVEVVKIVVRDRPAEPPPVITMREVMQAAAVNAVTYIGHTTLAAKALHIPHGRLKQLLREAGDTRDRRHDEKRKTA